MPDYEITFIPAPEVARKSLLSDLKEVPQIKIGDNILQVEFGEDLKPALKEIAVKELRETPENQEAGIAELKRLIQEDTELKAPVDNEAWLIKFLRPTKYYPESANKLVKHYYKFKKNNADIYQNLLPSNEKLIFESDILTCLLNRDQLGRRVLIVEFGKWNPDKVSLDQVFKGVVLCVEVALMEPETQICGASVVFDMAGLTLSQATKFTPGFAKRMVDWLQDSVPARVKNIHVIDQPYVFKMVFALFKPFLREKLRKRIIFHGTDREALYAHINKECLPAQYGGTSTMPRIPGPTQYELLLKVEDEYKAINSYGYPYKK